MSKRRFLRLVLMLAMAPLLLQGCAVVIIGGVATGAAVIHDRRSSGTVLDDQGVELKALHMLTEDAALNDHSNIGVTSYNLVVLLTGEAESAGISDRFAGRVQKIEGVKRVVNEVRIGPSATIGQMSEDSLITTRVKVALFDVGIEGFDPTRIKVVTSQKTVYLMGLVSQPEANAVVQIVRNVSGVNSVVKIFEYLKHSG